MKKMSTLILSILMFTEICFSQHRQFQHITSDDGLSQSEVYSFLKDSQGFMWFGTVDGLNKYDGYSIRIFNTDSKNLNSIPNNTIRSIVEDSLKRVWIGTDDGLCFYDIKSDQLFRIKLPEHANKKIAINKVLVYQKQLYIGSSNGLILLDINSREIGEIEESAQIIQINAGTNSYDVVDCILANTGRIWIASPSYLYQVKRDSLTDRPVLYEELTLSGKLKNTRNISEDSYGNLWIALYENGIIRYNPESGYVRQFMQSAELSSTPTNQISSTAIDSSGNIWIGTHDQGLLLINQNELNNDNPSFESINHQPYDDRSLNSNLIYSLYVSEDKLIWIGTIASGINIFDPNRKAFTYYNLGHVSNQSTHSTSFTRSVLGFNNNETWVGTHNNGLLQISNDRNIRKLGFGKQSVFHLQDTREGYIFVCTGEGLNVVKQNRNSLEILSSLDLGPTFFVTPIHENFFWVATLNGVYKCSISNGILKTEDHYNSNSSPPLSADNCRVLLFSNKTNQLYIGTEGGGLNVFKLNEKQIPIKSLVYKKDNSDSSISNNYIRSIYEKSNGDIWIGTYEGLNKLSINQVSKELMFAKYTMKHGLPNNMIQSIVEDEQKQLWIGTNKGLCKFNPTEELFTLYSVNDGIQSNEFSEHTIFKKDNGEIIIGGINGINIFNPKDITSQEFKPQTNFTNFTLFNKKIDVGQKIGNRNDIILKKSISNTDTIYLRANQNSFGIEFSSLSYHAPEKIKYTYILEGFDPEWNLTKGNERKVNYTNLNHGEYTFNVKATNNEGLWEDIPKTLFIKIKTPLYLTKVAYLLYGLLFLFATFFFTNYSVLKYKTKEKIILENKHNIKMRELEELRTRFFINTSHELRTPLTLISSPVQQLLQLNNELPDPIKQELQLVERNTNKLKDLVNDIMDLSKLDSGKLELFREDILIKPFLNRVFNNFDSICQHLGIENNLNIDIAEDITLTLDAGKVERIINNLLSNAIKHTSSGGTVSLHAFADDELLTIKVIDTGKGIPEEDQTKIFGRYFQSKQSHSNLQGGTGIGLAIVNELSNFLNGSIDVKSSLGEGSSFTLSLPVQFVNKNSNKNEAEETVIIEEALKNEIKYLQISPEKGFEKKHTILIVEDNLDMQLFLERLLKKRYYTLRSNHGKEAIEKLNEEKVDLILSDLMMPEMDGYSLLQHVKSHNEFKKLPFIMLTALDSDDHRIKALTLGIDDYLAKPFLPQELMARTHNLIKRYEERLSVLLGIQKENNKKKNVFETEALEGDNNSLPDSEINWVKNVESIMRKELENPDFNLADLASQLFLSERQFQRRMKQLTGMTPKKFQTEVALQYARELLERKAYGTVKAIAFSAGMSNVWRFSQLFEARFGKKPSQYISM